MAQPTPLTEYQQTYHWRNKNCGPWAQEWVKRTLPTVSASSDGNTASISSVTSVEGDCDLGQRKGKLLTIYDLEVSAKWTGKDSSENEFTGSVKIPEFSHEAIDGLSEYVFDISIDQSSSEADAFRQWLRKALPAALEPTLNGFRDELLRAHGIFETPAGSGASTPAAFKQGYSPAPPGEQHVKAVAAAAAKPEKKNENKLRTVTVEVSANLHASAEDMWSLLTDAQRVPMWSRSAATITPEKGAEFSLFNGNVTGKIVDATRPTKLVQSWQTKSPGWPADHYGTMTISLDQGSDSTKVTFALDGVPADKEADIERALDAFYIRGLKQMGLVLSSSSRTYVRESVNSASALASAGAAFGAKAPIDESKTKTKAKTKAKKTKRAGQPEEQGGVLSSLTSPTALGATAAVGAAAVFVALVAGSLRPPNVPS